MSDADVKIRIMLPLPLDVVSTVSNAISTAYPNGMIELRDNGGNLVVRIPEADRRKPKRVTKKAAEDGRVVAVDADHEATLLGWTENGIETGSPESVALPMATTLRAFFDKHPEAANYMEMKVHDREDPSKTYLVTACRSAKQTPHEIRQRIEAERDALVARIEAELECTALSHVDGDDPGSDLFRRIRAVLDSA